jgi:hypothetical protein
MGGRLPGAGGWDRLLSSYPIIPLKSGQDHDPVQATNPRVNILSIMRRPQHSRTADCGAPARHSARGAGLIFYPIIPLKSGQDHDPVQATNPRVNILSIMRRPQHSRTADCGAPARHSARGAGLIFLSLFPIPLSLCFGRRRIHVSARLRNGSALAVQRRNRLRV